MVEPESIHGQLVFDLASRPVWISGDEGLVILYEGGQLNFTCRNHSLAEAIHRMEMKSLHL